MLFEQAMMHISYVYVKMGLEMKARVKDSKGYVEEAEEEVKGDPPQFFSLLFSCQLGVNQVD